MNKQLHVKSKRLHFLTSVWIAMLLISGGIKAQGQGANETSPLSQIKVEKTSLRSGGADVTLNGTEYSWDEAMANLTNGYNEIVLLQDLQVKTWPAKSCTFKSDATNKKKLTYVAWNEELSSNVYARVNLAAPVTFKDIKLGIYQIVGNGYSLIFDEGVECTYPLTAPNDFGSLFGDNCTGIRNIWMGSLNSNVTETNLTIKSGTFGWMSAGSGDTGKVGSTHLTIEGGTIYGDIWGGSFAGECTTTNITMKGGTIKSAGVYGGGWNDKVGTTNITIIDGNLEGSVFGGGSGNGSEYSICNNTNVTIEGGYIGVRLYGGGNSGKVTGTAKVVVSGGTISGAIFGGGGSYNSVYDDYKNATCQNTDLSIGNAQLGFEGIFAGGNGAAVLGNAKLTFTGDLTIKDTKKPMVYASGQWAACNNAEIVIATDLKDKFAGIAVNTTNSGSVVTNGAKLTFKNLGTNGNAYDLPWDIEGFKTVALDNAYLKASTKKFVVDPATIVTTFEGTGFTTPININTKSTAPASPALLFMANGTTLPEPTIFAGVDNLNGKYIFRANHTYRLSDKASADFKTITFTPTANDTLSVSVDTTKLISGDKIPTGIELTARAASQYHYLTKIKKNDANLTPATFTVAEDAHLTMEVIEYLDLAEQKEDVTISKKDGAWQYLTKAITRSTDPEPINFNGTVKNTLTDGKIVDIDATSKGKLTFENAVINSDTRTDAALTIKSGANVTISGSLEVKANEANSFAILNNGAVTINNDGTLKATNQADADKGISVVSSASMLVSGTGASLTSSGLKNQGTVVAKEGSTVTNSSSGSGDLLKTYVVTITNPGNGNAIAIKAAGIPVVSNDKVTVNTLLTINGVAASNYTLKEITATTIEGTTTITDGGTYTMPEKEVTFAATFKQKANPPYVPTYYTIILPEVKGVSTTPQAGHYVVEEGYNFSFSLILNAGYESSKPIVKANKIVVEPRESDNKYVIHNITSDMKISIEGIENPTGNTKIEGSAKVQAIGQTLHLYLPKEETIFIYTLSGLLYKEQALPAGNTQIPLVNGIYLVKIAGETHKIVIR